jgi:hypothetical protein
MDAQERPSRRHLAAMARRASSHSGPAFGCSKSLPAILSSRSIHRPPIGPGAETASQRHSCVRDYLSQESNATPWHSSRVCTSASRSLGRQPNSLAFVRSVLNPVHPVAPPIRAAFIVPLSGALGHERPLAQLRGASASGPKRSRRKLLTPAVTDSQLSLSNLVTSSTHRYRLSLWLLDSKQVNPSSRLQSRLLL